MIGHKEAFAYVRISSFHQMGHSLATCKSSDAAYYYLFLKTGTN